MESIETNLADGVMQITFNRPEKKNAFDRAQWRGLKEALDRARSDPEVAVVVLTGAGRDFSAGQDLSEMLSGGGEGDASHPFEETMKSLYSFDKPLRANATVAPTTSSVCFGVVIGD